MVRRDLRCGLCGRHASLFGYRRGICGICSSKKVRLIAEMIAFKIFKSIPIVQLVTDYICKHPKQRMQFAVHMFWRTFFFSHDYAVRVRTGQGVLRDANSDDEEPDGALRGDLTFVNPLHKLCHGGGRNNPIDIIIDMLPLPPRIAIQSPLSHT